MIPLPRMRDQKVRVVVPDGDVRARSVERADGGEACGAEAHHAHGAVLHVRQWNQRVPPNAA